MNNVFGDYLKSLRRSHTPPMTQETLAVAVGRSKMTISQFESGKNSPPQGKLLHMLADALDLSDDEKEKFVFLAAKSRKTVPEDIEAYFFDNPSICSVIRTAMNSKESVDWQKIADFIGGNHEQNC